MNKKIINNLIEISTFIDESEWDEVLELIIEVVEEAFVDGANLSIEAFKSDKKKQHETTRK